MQHATHMLQRNGTCMHTVNILAKGWCIVSRWVHLQQSAVNKLWLS